MKTYSAKPSDITRSWHLLDASELPLGRLSTVAAKLLTGKDKVTFTKHVDCGDYVVVVNANKIVVTGSKMDKKIYYRHTGFPGGIKQMPLKDMMIKDPTKAITNAIRGMLPVNKLRPDRLARLKVYAGPAHEHEAQKPVKIELKEIT